jgi:hypothetical protein
MGSLMNSKKTDKDALDILKEAKNQFTSRILTKAKR